MRAVKNTLDFIVIGAQKAGTTSLFEYLRGHPELSLPPDKEAPFFSSEEARRRGFEDYMRKAFAFADPSSKWGTVTPQYMVGGLLEHPNPSTNDVSAYVYDLMALMTASRQREDLESAQRAEEALRGAMVEIVSGMGSSTPGAISEMIGPYIELLVDLRLSFRESKQWDQADLIRDRLTNLGIVLEDGPQGTTWHQQA